MSDSNSILVVGGAGYIGSHMTQYLMKEGYSPVVLDDVSFGNKLAIANVPFVLGNIVDTMLLQDVFSTYQFSAVMHFASFIQVGESLIHPEKYYHNNVAATLNLLKVMKEHHVNKMIFSSTAAVYGNPQCIPITEDHPICPINPYGWSKHMVEQILKDFSIAYDFQYASLRYFNAAGADPSGELCEDHQPETHLIPILFNVVNKIQDAVTVNGKNYPTPDGTCIRDFIHVNDLCSAHLLALKKLNNEKKSFIYNSGTGEGHSVKQVIDMVELVTQQTIKTIYGKKRLGDPAILIADPTRAKQELKWIPRYSDLKTIIEYAWNATKKKR